MEQGKTINDALVAIQHELKAHKGQWNDFGKYHYRSCEDILEAVKPLLKERGVALTMSDIVTQACEQIFVEVTVTLSNGTEQICTKGCAMHPLIKKGMDAQQISGTASSYARKFALGGLFCLDDTKDSDATNKHLDDKNTVQQPADKQRRTASKPRTPAKPPQAQKTQPPAQDKPLARDIGIIVSVLAQLEHKIPEAKVWLYDTACISSSDKLPAKFTNTEAMAMIELMRQEYSAEMESKPEEQEDQDDHSDEPDFITVACPEDGCGAEMEDKRKYGGKVAFKCPNSDWDKETKTENGCKGTIWQDMVNKHPEQYPEIGE